MKIHYRDRRDSPGGNTLIVLIVQSYPGGCTLLSTIYHDVRYLVQKFHISTDWSYHEELQDLGQPVNAICQREESEYSGQPYMTTG